MFPTKKSTVPFKPLTEMMLACRGNNPATVETMASGLSYIVRELQHTEKKTLYHLSTKLEDVSNQLEDLKSLTSQGSFAHPCSTIPTLVPLVDPAQTRGGFDI